LTTQEYISSGAIEACILGMATQEELLQYHEMRQYSEVVAYANDFELSLEQDYLSKATLAPQPQTFTKIKAAIGNTAPVVQMNSTPKKKSFWREYGVAASIALLLGSMTMNFILMNRLKQTQADLVAANTKNPNGPSNVNGASMAFLKEPTITPIALYGVGIHAICRCSLYWDKANKKGYFLIHHLAPTGEQKDYQVWAEVDGKPVSLGIVKYDPNKEPIIINGIPEGATKFTVTLEPKGGSVKPTLEQMFLQGEIST
jgi:anti-sigma-K factor RskA